jgi:two-component system sensor histidine kinase KdpD
MLNLESYKLKMKTAVHHSDMNNCGGETVKRKKTKFGIRLLVMIGAGKSSAKLICHAKYLSRIIGAELLVLHIENTRILGHTQQEQLSKNIDLARQLGAEVIITSGNDLVSTALDIAKKENVEHIIIGKSGKRNFFSSLLMKPNLVNRLLRKSGNINIYVFGAEVDTKEYRKNLHSYFDFRDGSCRDYLLAISAVFVIITLCLPLSMIIGYRSMSYILLFMLLILSTLFRFGPVMSASIVSAVTWNFFFIPPQYALSIKEPEDLLAFCMFFIVAFVTGTLTSKIRKQERLTRKKEEKTDALYHLTNQLAGADQVRQILDMAKINIEKYFKVKAFFFLRDDNTGKLKRYTVKSENLSELEYNKAQWVFRHSQKAGKYTDNLSSGEHTFYPLRGIKTKPGVIVIEAKERFGRETELFWETFLTQISNALEHHFLSQSVKKANLLNESDKLYKTLFNSISHELRIPIATIMGASDTLLTNSYPENVKEELYTEILSASNRLNRLIENLLNMSRIETGKIAPHIDWCDVNDLFNHVADNLKDSLKPFRLNIEIPSSMPMVKLDVGLMEQVLHNLIYNSCKYADTGTTIAIKAFYDNGYLNIQEMDQGQGFPPEVLTSIFDKFYRVYNKNLGGLGLGLSIVKGFVEAHKGTISVENRQEGGALFTIKIPTETSYANNFIMEQHV